jgi:hypothetical protein
VPALASEFDGHGEQDCGVLDGHQVVLRRRQDQMITRGALPHVVASGHADPAPQHLQGGLAGTLVLIEAWPAASTSSV